jgi:hypothetical protein
MSEVPLVEKLKFKPATEAELISGCSGAAAGTAAGMIYIAVHDFPRDAQHFSQETLPHASPVSPDTNSNTSQGVEIIAPATTLALVFAALTSALRYGAHRRRTKQYITSGLNALEQYAQLPNTFKNNPPDQ